MSKKGEKNNKNKIYIYIYISDVKKPDDVVFFLYFPRCAHDRISFIGVHRATFGGN